MLIEQNLRTIITSTINDDIVFYICEDTIVHTQNRIAMIDRARII